MLSSSPSLSEMPNKPRLRSLHSREPSALVVDIPSINIGKSRKRWRFAFVVICSARALQSVAQGIVAKTTHTVLDINPTTVYRSLNDQHLFHIEPASLTKMVKEKNFNIFRDLGGVEGIVIALETDVDNGICSDDDDDVKRRREAFGSNTYHKPPPKGFLYFMLESLKDPTIIILLICATLSLGFGIKENGIKEGWYDGTSILFAVFLVIVVSVVTNFRQSRQFDDLSKVSNNIQVNVIRNGRLYQISIFDIVVGDVVNLKIGDQIPADGLFLDGHSLEVDESSMTGESDHIEVYASNPFLFSGAKIANGYGRMVVTSVGMSTLWGEMMSSISNEIKEQTPLQSRLNKLTSSIGKVGLATALLVLLALLIRYFTGHSKDENGNREFNAGKTKFDDVMNAMVRFIAAAVTIVVVAIPEGLPLAVTLTLAYSMKRMMADHAMVRKLSACETMGSATAICTDKTGTLTMNQMKVTTFWLGEDNITSDPMDVMAPNIIELLHQGVSQNTTASVYKATRGSEPELSGSPTEKAIILWALEELDMDIGTLKQKYVIVHVETFNSEKKRSGVLIKSRSDNTFHVHWKGAAEIILAMCSSYCNKYGIIEPLDDDKRNKFLEIIESMAAEALRCIAFAHKKIARPEFDYIDDGKSPVKLNEDDLTFLGVVGIKDPCRPGVKDAVKVCRDAGVNIKMITGDNIFTAKAIAMECGILKSDQSINNCQVVEGKAFRELSDQERMDRVDNIRIMARSSPLDKLLMVRCLKEKGHVVAVTGDGTNDAPALKEADVGLSMGIQGTEVAKESSDIVILDDNFTSVVTVLKWGRCVYNNIQKFIQFQLTVNVAALVINFIAACSAGEVPLTAVQLLWVNLIMDTLGALALATERPTDELMRRPPIGRTEPLVTNVMWRNLTFQALYQIAILLALQFKGRSIFKVSETVKNTLIFNTFVLCQVFNEFNARRLERKNVFTGILRNQLFLSIVAITIVLQVAMVEFLQKFANTERLNWLQWIICLVLAAVSWPLGWVAKCIPVPEKPFLSYVNWKS